jgi:hypothetical protein
MKKITVITAIAWLGLGLNAEAAEIWQRHYVCTGEYEAKCKNQYPNLPIEWNSPLGAFFFPCGDTTKDAICLRYCGVPETPTTCSQERLGQVIGGDHCGYAWVIVSCYTPFTRQPDLR